MAITLKKVSMANNATTLIMMALEMGFNNPEGMDKETLVRRINKRVEARLNPQKTQKSPKANKVKVTNSKVVELLDKEVVFISGRIIAGKQILEGRQMVVTGSKGESLIGFLVNSKDGSLQRSEILMPKVNTFKTLKVAQ